MYVLENPVLQNELLANLRLGRSFLLLLAYVAALGGIVFLAWPADRTLDLTQNPEASKRLVNMFFLGQYLLTSLMAPSFAAAAITGEKERKSYEMLLASPLRPGAIVLGKLIASIAHLAILMICSLPIIMLCLPLGGVSLYEVLVAYLAMIVSIVLYGMISIACSSYFQRTAASLVVSYMIILPLALFGVLFWSWTERFGGFRLIAVLATAPTMCLAVSALLWVNTSRRLLYPADLGSEGKEVVDLEAESNKAVGLYIKRDEFPDRLFAPPKRTDFIADGVNPIFDKEMRSEIFAQGTLMLRVVIQISMLVAVAVMAACLFIWPQYAAWYVAYVVLFNMLVGPVFSAGSVTQERERQTLDLLLTTMITPWQMLWGKLFSGLRVSSVLTSFLLWPMVLACLMPFMFWSSLPTMVGYFLIVGLTCVTTAVIALFCSVFFRKTSISLMTSYFVIATQFILPPAANYFAETFFPNTRTADAIQIAGAVSPVSAAFSLPLHLEAENASAPVAPRAAATTGGASGNSAYLFFAYVGFTIIEIALLAATMIWLFKRRWRVSE